MPEYTVQSPLLHDGDKYEVGQSVTMKEQQAELLLEQGVLQPAAAELHLADPGDEMTVAELTRALADLKIDIPPGSKKADLVALYDQAVDESIDDGNPS